MSLGFAAGVMTAASYWSLLEPAIEMCKTSGFYGDKGQYAFAPVAVGFLFGAIFVYGTDRFLDYLGLNSTNMMMSEYSYNIFYKEIIFLFVVHYFKGHWLDSVCCLYVYFNINNFKTHLH